MRWVSSPARFLKLICSLADWHYASLSDCFHRQHACVLWTSWGYRRQSNTDRTRCAISAPRSRTAPHRPLSAHRSTAQSTTCHSHRRPNSKWTRWGCMLNRSVGLFWSWGSPCIVEKLRQSHTSTPLKSTLLSRVSLWLAIALRMHID